jgi:hypothetical protein
MMNGLGHGWGMGIGWIGGLVILGVIVWIIVSLVNRNNKTG